MYHRHLLSTVFRLIESDDNESLWIEDTSLSWTSSSVFTFRCDSRAGGVLVFHWAGGEWGKLSVLIWWYQICFSLQIACIHTM